MPKTCFPLRSAQAALFRVALPRSASNAAASDEHAHSLNNAEDSENERAAQVPPRSIQKQAKQGANDAAPSEAPFRLPSGCQSEPNRSITMANRLRSSTILSQRTSRHPLQRALFAPVASPGFRMTSCAKSPFRQPAPRQTGCSLTDPGSAENMQIVVSRPA